MTTHETIVQYTKILLMLLVAGYIIWRVETIVGLLRHLGGKEPPTRIVPRETAQFYEPVSDKEKISKADKIDDLLKQL